MSLLVVADKVIVKDKTLKLNKHYPLRTIEKTYKENDKKTRYARAKTNNLYYDCWISLIVNLSAAGGGCRI
jgi:hypothetical protein